MSYTLIDYTKAFHSLSKTLKLSASVRSVYAAIIGEANEAHFPERIGISDRELKELAGVKSVASAHEAKNVLKNHHLIDFKRSAKGVTEYWLLSDHLRQPNTYRTEAEQEPNASRTTLITITNPKASDRDVKTLDERRARARGGESNGRGCEYRDVPEDTGSEPWNVDDGSSTCRT